MGFISYHGEKEDRYTEVLAYSRARQEEEDKKNQEEKIAAWLKDFTGDDKLAHLNIQQLLKLLFVEYRTLFEQYKNIVDSVAISSGCDTSYLWKDFSIDLADRHIQSFHVKPEVRVKHLQTFIDKIFKLSGVITASEHTERLIKNSDYRKYFVECFDPTWTGRNFYHFLQYVAKDKDIKSVDDFFEEDKKFILILNLYFYLAFRPRDDGWRRQIEAEQRAIEEVKDKYYTGESILLNPAIMQNPLYKKDFEYSEKVITTGEDYIQDINNDDSMNLPKSGLDRAKFMKLLELQGIPNYILACKLLLNCEMPEEIRDNYNELIKRMPILKDAVDKYDNIYHADLNQFEDYFAPEALKITATLVEYEVVKPSAEILRNTRENVFQASKKLLLLVNEKIEEIYKFVTIETNAEAKALEALMSQNGYVDPELKLRRN